MNIRIPWIWVTVGLFLLIELLLLWAFDRQDDRHRATLLFGATIVAGAFALYSYLHRIQEKRFKEAGRMMKRWNAPERLVNRVIMANVTDGLFDISTIRRLHAAHKFDKETHETRIQVLSALNFYEELPIGIFEKSIDDDRSRRFFYSMANQAYEVLQEWIQNERNVDHTQNYYIEFEKLIRQWRDKAVNGPSRRS